MALEFDQPIRLPMIPAFEGRDISRSTDAMLINCYAEKLPQTGGYKIRKRFGTGPVFLAPTPAAGLGIYYWAGYTFHASGNKFYQKGSAIKASGMSQRPVYFTELGAIVDTLGLGEQSGYSNFLVFQDGTNGFYIEFISFGFPVFPSGPLFAVFGAVTTIASAGFPTGFKKLVPGLVTLNNRAYVMEATGAIHGSDINNPASWDPLNVIVANEDPDIGMMLAKHYNYIVAMKARTLQFFYDNGNPTGSVLSPVQGATKRLGCASGRSVQDIDSTLLWVSSNDSDLIQVIRMDKMETQVISTPMIERLLSAAAIPVVVDPSDVRFTGDNIRSSQIKYDGHKFYVLTLTSNAALPPPYASYSQRFSLVYDLDEDLWYFWGDKPSGNLDTISYFPYISSPVGPRLWQDINTGAIYPFDTDDIYPTDKGAIPVVEIITPNFDADTANSKTLSKLSFVTDKVPGSELFVRCNDHDYAPDKWASWRRVNLGVADPFLSKEGSFIRRAYQFRHQSATPMTIRAVDMHLSEGSKR